MTVEEILWNLRIDSLTAMQQDVVEEYRKGKDLVLLAPTGSGKTLAYLIPLVLSLSNAQKGAGTVKRVGIAD